MSEEFELKLLSLIGKLSNEVTQLKQEVEKMQHQIDSLKLQNESEVESEKISLTTAREYLKEKISVLYPKLIYTHGSRSLGTKLTISNGVNTINTLIRTSKSHREKERYASGWITIDEKQISDFPINFFVVEDFQGQYNCLVIKRNELEQWASRKKSDSTGRLHFYVNCISGKWIDDRDDINFDCSKFFNNWDTIIDVLEGNGG